MVCQPAGRLHTIYPQNAVSDYNCLHALAFDSNSSPDDTIHVLDSCTGDWIQLKRMAASDLETP